MRCVAAILETVALAPLVYRLLRDAETLRQSRRRLITCLDRSPYLRRRRGLVVKTISMAAPRSERLPKPILP